MEVSLVSEAVAGVASQVSVAVGWVPLVWVLVVVEGTLLVWEAAVVSNLNLVETFVSVDQVE